MFTPTGPQVSDWLASAGGRFELAWSSLAQPPQPNASEPPIPLQFSTRNATDAPGDLHIFYRSTLGMGLERIIDSLVSQRTDDWYFSPLVDTQLNFYDGEVLRAEAHYALLPSIYVEAPEWPQTDYRQLIPTLNSMLPPGSILERHTQGLGRRERFVVFSQGRDGYDHLDLALALRSVPGVRRVGTGGRLFLLPGDRCLLCVTNGPSGGPSGGAPTAVPISSAVSRTLLIFGLFLAGTYWIRRGS